jgi:hypothetical protein
MAKHSGHPFLVWKVIVVSNRLSIEVKVGSIALVYVGTRISRSLADRFSRKCAELECSPQETLTALIEAFVEGASGEPGEQRQGMQDGFPPASVPWVPMADEDKEREDLPNEEDVWAFWRDMQQVGAEAVRESRLPFVITPFQN